MEANTQSKVIAFPPHKVVREVPEEQIIERNRRADQKFCDSVVDDLCGMVITELDNYFINVQDEAFTKDFILVADSLKAAIYRQFDLEHHLHEFVDNNVKLIKGDVSEMSAEEVRAKIDQVIKELQETKENLDETE